MTSPTEAEINRGIAEWMGWKWSDHPECIAKAGESQLAKWRVLDPEGESQMAYDAPSFTTSHDECHQALARMTDVQVEEVGYGLIWMIDPNHGTERRSTFLLATAHQKALAIYRVVKGVS